MHPQILEMVSTTPINLHRMLFFELSYRMETNQDSVFTEMQIEKMFAEILTPTEIVEALNGLVLHEAVDYYDNREVFLFRGAAEHEQEPYNHWLKIRELVFATEPEATA